MIKRIAQFLQKDIWLLQLDELGKVQAFLVQQLRILLIAIRGFAEDKCQLQASALTYYTLLSIVPVVAMIFGIAKGFGLEGLLEKELRANVSGHEEVVTMVLDFSHSLLENTKGGLIAGFGIALLFWSVMKLLGNIESSFNDIWQVKKPRTLTRKFTEYLSIMLVAPILIILSGSATVFIATQLSDLASTSEMVSMAGPLIVGLIKILPYLLVWLLFTFIYMVMPNTRVTFISALMAGIMAGTAFQISEWAYLNFQFGVGKYNAIYGSFAALPLFLIWVQLGWLIVLFGAEISFANQNLHLYEYELDKQEVSVGFRKTATLLITHLLIKNFVPEGERYTISKIANDINLPTRLVRQSINQLLECGIVAEVNTDSARDPAYQPAVNPDLLTVSFVLEALEEYGMNDIPISKNQTFEELKKTMEGFKKEIRDSSGNRKLIDI